MNTYEQWRETEVERLLATGHTDRDTIRQLLVFACHSSPQARGFFAGHTEDAALLDSLLDIAVEDYSGDAQMTASHWVSQFPAELLAKRMSILEAIAVCENDSVAAPAREALEAVRKGREHFRIYAAQIVVKIEDQWFGPSGLPPPIRTAMCYHVATHLFAAANAEAAYRTASNWLPGFADSTHDGPGDLTVICAAGIHQIEEVLTTPRDLNSALHALYGVDLGVFDPDSRGADGAPLVRGKAELSIFRYG